MRKHVLGLLASATLVFGLVGCSGEAEPITMPDVVGKALDVALSDLERAGYGDEPEILGGGMFGVLDESNWVVCEQLPLSGKTISEQPRLTVDRSCGDTVSESDSDGDTTTDAYDGPAYEIVTTDRTGIGLDQYWVYTDPMDYTTLAYRDEFKAIITDVVRDAGSTDVIVQVVTDREIALSESVTTHDAFIEEHGEDYFLHEIVEKETLGWVASYTGGYDYESGELSTSAAAYEVIWFGSAIPQGDPNTATEIEKWKPAAK